MFTDPESGSVTVTSLIETVGLEKGSKVCDTRPKGVSKWKESLPVDEILPDAEKLWRTPATVKETVPVTEQLKPQLPTVTDAL
jgi:hypothetical protein